MLSTLTIGIAWNGVGDIEATLRNASSATFVTETLVSPSSLDAAKALEPLIRKYPKSRALPPGDTGIYAAYNKLIAGARTTHLCFHGADDFVVPTSKLEHVLPGLAADEMLVCTAQFCTASGAARSTYHHVESSPARIALGRHTSPATPEVIYPVATLRNCGGADESYRIAGDADLYFRVRALCKRTDLDDHVVEMRDGGASTAARHARTVWLENSRIAQRNQQEIPTSSRIIAAAALNFRYGLYRIGGERFSSLVTDALRLVIGRRPRYSID